MKILLVRYHNEGNINTRFPEKLNKAQGVYHPLGIAYIAAVLEKKGYDVKVLDVQALNLTSAEARISILKEKADLVGITSMTSTFSGVLECSRFAKESGAKTLVGGPQTSTLPREVLSFDSVDFINIGDAEEMMPELVDALENNKPINNIIGLGHKKNGEIVMNPPAIVKDINKLPFPARHLLPMDKYDCIIAEKPFTTMIATRGCPFKCGFCFRGINDGIFRTRDPANVVDEMEECVKEYGVKYIMFYDETLTLRKENTRGICNEIIRRGLKVRWESPTRADCVDEELLRLMKKAGCVRLRFGVESGNERILKLMDKRISLDKVRETFKTAKKIGIERFAYFVIGYFSEDEKTIRDTINFAKELDPDWAMFLVATPLPNTPLMKLAVENGIIDENYWRDYSMGKTKERMPYLVKDADKWVKRAYREFYFRPSVILNKIKKLNSFDNLKKNIIGAYSI